ncbi:MAG: AhpC/TSA family protein [Bacteroidetes bacterium]|nr:AhpC/TSA family protein [Bacteroidota bacterium]
MKRILVLLVTLSIISCNTDTSNYKLEGNALGFADGTNIFVFTVIDNNQPKVIDTLTVTNESFIGEYPKNELLSINYLQVENLKGRALFFPENTNLKATLYKDSLQSSFVTGSQQNDSYKLFNEKIKYFGKQKNNIVEAYKLARKEQDDMLASELKKQSNVINEAEKSYKLEFVSENPNSLFAVLLLTEMVSRKEVSAAEASRIATKLSPKVAATTRAKSLKSLINNMKKADVGSEAPNFSAPTPEGTVLSLNEVLGKYTIIDFWASWCKPCRRENPNVVKVYNQYHEKGLNIISVSLDKPGQESRWIKAIKDDDMNWHHVSNLKGWNDPIAKIYNVRSIPATFLLDEKGNIIAKNLRGNALGAKIASLLGD